MHLGRILASTCRQEILKTLTRMKQTHVMDLVRKVNSTHGEVTRNLSILADEKIIVVKEIGRMKIIQLNRNNERTQHLLRALNILEEY